MHRNTVRTSYADRRRTANHCIADLDDPRRQWRLAKMMARAKRHRPLFEQGANP